MRFLGFILIIISAATFGLMPIFATFAYKSGLNIESILLFRFLVSAILINAYILIKKLSYPKGKTLIILIFMGAILYSAQAFSYFTSISLIGSSLTSILLYLYPSIVLLLSVVLLKVKVHKQDFIALLLTTIGAILVVGLKFENINILGMIFGIAAALIYSFYIIIGAKVMSGTSPVVATGVVIGSSAFIYVTYGLSIGAKFPQGIEQWKWILAISLVSTIIAIITFFAGLKLIGPLKSSMVSTFELVVTLFCSYLFLGEKMGIFQIIGSVFILISAIILAKEKDE
ncbi:MAG: DMT family transporter [Epsilonproteobacteria bacterium]|nr:DMT family transporter [Campylobacterota bacterium]